MTVRDKFLNISGEIKIFSERKKCYTKKSKKKPYSHIYEQQYKQFVSSEKILLTHFLNKITDFKKN